MRTFHVIGVGSGLLAMVVGAAGEARAQGGWTDAGVVVHLTTGSDRVGIGTTTPGAKLHVTGSAIVEGRVVSEVFDAPGTTMLHLRVGGRDGWRLVPTVGTPNIIGGASINVVRVGVVGATIAGGGDAAVDDELNALRNVVTDDFGTIGGGRDNRAGNGTGTTSDATGATVGGGLGNTAGDIYSTVGGGLQNVASGALATIGGGETNAATGDGTTVGGGFQNIASNFRATIAGGWDNISSGDGSTVGGGVGNDATAFASTTAGGFVNRASGEASAVAGGQLNIASGSFATVAGGHSNLASGFTSFAAGRRAKADDQGAFVWADSTDADFASQGPDQFVVRAAGGARLVKGASTFSPTLATFQVESTAAAGEGALLRNHNQSNTSAVIKLIKAGGGDFLQCRNNIGAGEVARCHINGAGTFVAGSDFAEALPARGGKAGYEPGDVLVLSGDREGTVDKATRAHDVRVAGVYSTRPGVLGADKDGATRIDAHDIPVAIVGIVPTKVSAENGAIAPGDLLTTATVPGHAMKASPVIVSGVALYPTGTILGKALGSLENGTGLIRVLITLK